MIKESRQIEDTAEGQTPQTQNERQEESSAVLIAAQSSAPSTKPACKPRKKLTPRKITTLAFSSLGIAVVVFLFIIAVTLAVDKFVRKSPAPSFAGYSTLIVTTGSMNGTIDEGDMIIIKKAKSSTRFKTGDIVTFVSPDTQMLVTHRIIRISGDRIYTKGDANNAEDTHSITSSDIVGTVTKRIPHVGLFFRWVKESGWIYFVAAAAVIIVGVVLLKNPPVKSKPAEKEEKAEPAATQEPEKHENE